jgi:hypothetical protein
MVEHLPMYTLAYSDKTIAYYLLLILFGNILLFQVNLLRVYEDVHVCF